MASVDTAAQARVNSEHANAVVSSLDGDTQRLLTSLGWSVLELCEHYEKERAQNGHRAGIELLQHETGTAHHKRLLTTLVAAHNKKFGRCR